MQCSMQNLNDSSLNIFFYQSNAPLNNDKINIQIQNIKRRHESLIYIDSKDDDNVK